MKRRAEISENGHSTDQMMVDVFYTVLKYYMENETSPAFSRRMTKWLTSPLHANEKDAALRRLFEEMMDDSTLAKTEFRPEPDECKERTA